MFRLDKEKPLPHEDSQALKQGSRGATQSPTLEVFKTCLGEALSNQSPGSSCLAKADPSHLLTEGEFKVESKVVCSTQSPSNTWHQLRSFSLGSSTEDLQHLETKQQLHRMRQHQALNSSSECKSPLCLDMLLIKVIKKDFISENYEARSTEGQSSQNGSGSQTEYEKFTLIPSSSEEKDRTEPRLTLKMPAMERVRLDVLETKRNSEKPRPKARIPPKNSFPTRENSIPASWKRKSFSDMDKGRPRNKRQSTIRNQITHFYIATSKLS
ncbi:hypothetical protein QYF61_022052 [Mycteria americana]|uniref:Uncharacterized protein n=1 Tax=Mycteria americana TaxID=33587 RepID=A0AAN7NKY6_MYCAM|nr:hypothetical protein QYF61_022052 [Mycteria americana]